MGSHRNPVELANRMLLWMCIAVRDLCGLPAAVALALDEKDFALYWQSTRSEVIVEITIPRGVERSAFDAILGAHHTRDFVEGADTDAVGSDPDAVSLVYVYNYEAFNAPSKTNWTEQPATFSFHSARIPAWFGVKRDGRYPPPRPVELRDRRKDKAKGLPGRLVFGDPECTWVEGAMDVERIADVDMNVDVGSSTMGVGGQHGHGHERRNPEPEDIRVREPPRRSPSPSPQRQLQQRVSEHAFVPYQSIIPRSASIVPQEAAAAAPGPASFKLGKQDPDEEEAAARAYMNAPSVPSRVTVEVKHEPLDGDPPVRVKPEPFEDVGLGAGAGAAQSDDLLDRVMAAMREREAAAAAQNGQPNIAGAVEPTTVRDNRKEGEDLSQGSDGGDDKGLMIKQEALEAAIPPRDTSFASTDDPEFKRVKVESISASIPRARDMDGTIELEGVLMGKAVKMEEKVKTERRETFPDSGRVKAEPISAAIPPAQSPFTRVKPEPVEGTIPKREPSVEARVKPQPRDASIPCRQGEPKREPDAYVQLKAEEKPFDSPVKREPQSDRLSGSRGRSYAPERSMDPFAGYGDEEAKHALQLDTSVSSPLGVKQEYVANVELREDMSDGPGRVKQEPQSGLMKQERIPEPKGRSYAPVRSFDPFAGYGDEDVKQASRTVKDERMDASISTRTRVADVELKEELQSGRVLKGTSRNYAPRRSFDPFAGYGDEDKEGDRGNAQGTVKFESDPGYAHERNRFSSVKKEEERETRIPQFNSRAPPNVNAPNLPYPHLPPRPSSPGSYPQGKQGFKREREDDRPFGATSARDPRVRPRFS
ncbi:hypothetical protein MKEN_01147300 [Mycena kentingensis (nom. inval.)]|nr:hypothetical protein MKEN_01147300 [Mycena kentingensis (nom. inval.)]